jgi:hypothetical protein
MSISLSDENIKRDKLLGLEMKKLLTDRIKLGSIDFGLSTEWTNINIYI